MFIIFYMFNDAVTATWFVYYIDILKGNYVC